MAYNTYHNPNTVLVDGSTPVTGVVSVSVNVTMAEIHGAADDETHEGVARHGTARTSGTITTLDPEEADGLSGTTGDLTFRAMDVKGGSPGYKTCTIADASFGGWNATITRDGVSACSVPFIAEVAPSWA